MPAYRERICVVSKREFVCEYPGVESSKDDVCCNKSGKILAQCAIYLAAVCLCSQRKNKLKMADSKLLI